MAKKYLITSALPYVNGELHLGHLIGCYLPSDVYARFCRAMGRDVLYVCGADEHGTPAIVGAAAEGMSIIDYNNKYYEKHYVPFVTLTYHLICTVVPIQKSKKN